MKKCQILLPESAKEFLAEAQGYAVVVPVIMRDGRFLRLQYSLQPQVCNGEYVPEEGGPCPGCGLVLESNI